MADLDQSVAQFTGDSDKQQRIIGALLRVSRFITAVANLEDLLTRILDESRELVDCEASSVLLFDEESQELYFDVVQGPKADELKAIRLKLGQGLAGTCAEERETILVNDTRKDTRFFKGADEKTTYATRNLIAVPMIRGEKLIGVLEVLNKDVPEGFSPDDIKLAEFVADQSAVAIENAILIRDAVKAERLAAVGVAVASIAHYAKNLLHGVKGSTEIIDIALEKGKHEFIDETWPILKQSLSKITGLVKDMLTYSKPREPVLEKGDLNLVMDDIYNNQNDRAEDLKVNLQQDLDEEAPPSWFDHTAIHDTLLNFTTNAVEACEGIEGAAVSFATRFDAEKNMISAYVADNGPGIPPELQKKIFEPFFSTKAGKGTGLGLAMCRKAIEEHKGDVTIESTVGEGTIFGIHLPVDMRELS